MEQQAQQAQGQQAPEQPQQQANNPEPIGREDPLADALGVNPESQNVLADFWDASDQQGEPSGQQGESSAQQSEPSDQPEPQAGEESTPKAEKETKEAPKEHEEKEESGEELLPEPVLKMVEEYWPGEIIETPEQLKAKLQHLRDLETAAGLLEAQLPDEMWSVLEQYIQQVQELESRLGRDLGDVEKKRVWWSVLEESGVLETRPPDPNEDPEGYTRWVEAEALRRAQARQAMEEQQRQQELEMRREQRLEALAREFRERHQIPDEEYESFITQVQRLMVGDPETGELPRRPNVFEVLYLGLKALQGSYQQQAQASSHGKRPARRPPDLTGQSGGPRPQPQPTSDLDYLIQIAEEEAKDPWSKIL